MKRSTIMVGLALLTVASLGVATLAIAHRHRVESRVAELERTNRVGSAAKPATRPTAVAARPSANIPPPKAANSSSTKEDGKPRSPARPDVGELFAAHPELQAAYQRAVGGRLHQTYGRLFGRLGLSSAQIDQAVALLVQDAEHELDLAMTAQTLQLATDDPALWRFRGGEKSDTEAKLESLLGAQGMQTWRDYNRALGMRATAEDVASLTLATDTPMTGAQMEQLTRVLAEASSTYREGGLPEWSTTDWPEVLRHASTFLTPAQLVVLQAKIQQAAAAALLSQFYASRPQR
jgi:hypothetical protein